MNSMLIERRYWDKKIGDIVIARELKYGDNSIACLDYNNISKETAQELIDKLINERNVLMDKALDEGLIKMYNEERLRRFIPKDKYIEKHKRRILAIENSIFSELNLSSYDRLFFSSNATTRFLYKYFDLRDNLKNYWSKYNAIFIERHSCSGKLIRVYNRLAFACKHLELDVDSIISSDLHWYAFRNEKTTKIIASCLSTQKQLKKYRLEEKDLF